VALALAAILALGLSLTAPVAAPVRAALPDLTLVSNARYEVQPEDGRIRVTVDIVATNRLRDTATRRFFFDRAFLAVPPTAANLSLTAETGNPSVRVSEQRDGYQVIALVFGQRIPAGRSASFQLRFDMLDPGGAPDRELRVGQTFASFAAWAYASEATPGSTVSVVFPRGFDVTVETGDVPAPTVDAEGRTTYSTAKLAEPLSFLAYFVAERPASEIEYKDAPVTASLESGETAEVTVRAWPDDPDWSQRVGALFHDGLPVLAESIGLPWERDEPLVVQETVSRTRGGYAGLFDPREGRIEVAYYADAFVVLHEASHAWFNGALLADRWANEAFASYYAQSAGGQLEETIVTPELTDELRDAAFPLNEWRTGDGGVDAAETYGYAASLELARRIADRAGPEGLRATWQAIAEGEVTYPGPDGSDAETPSGPPDWRGLLDRLEEQTREPFDDLWREWVVTDEQAALLDERETARAEYQEVVAEAGPWDLPAAIRSAMRAWEFDTATDLLAEARDMLARRTELETAAAANDLTLPPRLQTVFESDAGFAAGHAEADAEQTTIDLVAAASGARVGNPDPLQTIGLVGEQPEAGLAAARSAFAAGDLERAAREAVAAQATWEGSSEVGRNRLLVGLGIALLVLLAIGVIVSALLGWRRARRERRRQRDRERLDPEPGISTAD
jgi:hypothetical protein